MESIKIAANMIQESRPGFLKNLDSDPDRAFAGFYEFTWRLLQSNPPSIMRGMSREDREDVISEVAYQCWCDNQRKLRSCRDQGKPFAEWLLVVAWHKAIDLLRKRHGRDVLSMEPSGDESGAPQSNSPGHEPPPNQTQACARAPNILCEALERLGNECKLLILLRVQGYKPREITIILGWSPARNKDISDQARYCINRLKEKLRESGHDWRKLIQGVSESPDDWVRE